METIRTYRGMTETHGFTLIVLRDARANRYIGQIDTSSPSAAPRLQPGQETPTVKHDGIEEVTHDSIAGVIDLAKKRISSRCGKILWIM